jgi:hypothetical protein
MLLVSAGCATKYMSRTTGEEVTGPERAWFQVIDGHAVALQKLDRAVARAEVLDLISLEQVNSYIHVREKAQAALEALHSAVMAYYLTPASHTESALEERLSEFNRLLSSVLALALDLTGGEG